MSDRLDDGASQRDAIVKIAFGAGALICVLAGLIVYIFASDLGLAPDTAQILAVAFLIAGFADYLVLRFWDRIVRRSPR